MVEDDIICFLCDSSRDDEFIKWYDFAGETICSICMLANWENPEKAVRIKQEEQAQYHLEF